MTNQPEVAEWEKELKNQVVGMLHPEIYKRTVSFITSLLASHEEKIRADWLRSEIEKLEREIWTVQATDDAHRFYQVKDHNGAIEPIITRYKEELKELEKGI